MKEVTIFGMNRTLHNRKKRKLCLLDIFCLCGHQHGFILLYWYFLVDLNSDISFVSYLINAEISVIMYEYDHTS